MNNSSIDSLAHFIAPDAQISNIYWWIGVIVVFILAVAGFVIKHFVKGRLLDSRPRPKVLCVDTQYPQGIAIHWKINGDDIKENGKQGTIHVTIK